MKASTTRPQRARAVLALAALLAAGCQDYNFNPVGKCLIAPARERWPLSDISTADVLFVVDDSGSMKFEQEQLGAAFSAFIENLNATNAERVAAGNDPIDFHIAVTTTSVFYNDEISTGAVVCRSDCPGGGASPVCCEMTSTQGGLAPARPYLGYQKCDAASECGGGLDCRSDCQGLLGEKYCCDPATKLLPLPNTPVACGAVGADCGAMQTHFRFDGACVPGNATNAAPYPQGAFVGFGDNPRVLHFDKELYPKAGEARDATLPACPAGVACNRQGFTADQLKGWFASEVGGVWRGNVIAGTCGSGQEQALQAAKLALEKALAKKQVDTRNARGVAEAGVSADWPHQNSKLVLVFVGDEDDCSSPIDPSRGVIMTASGGPGDDACTNDASGARRQQQVADFVSYFTSLNRPVAAAFVVSTAQSSCGGESGPACTAGICCPLVDNDDPSTLVCRDRFSNPVCSTATCGGQGPGVRLLDAATGLALSPTEPPAEIVRASVCDARFDLLLNRVAEIVKPPPGLSLPSRPASPQITVVRIALPDGSTRKTCRGPAPATLTAAQAVAEKWDWWFTATRGDTEPVTISQFIYINHGDPAGTGGCEANPGETYSADYVGLLPEGGCQLTQDCFEKLGGTTNPPQWSCYAGGSQETTWVRPSADNPGSCVCGDLGLDSAGNKSDYTIDPL